MVLPFPSSFAFVSAALGPRAVAQVLLVFMVSPSLPLRVRRGLPSLKGLPRTTLSHALARDIVPATRPSSSCRFGTRNLPTPNLQLLFWKTTHQTACVIEEPKSTYPKWYTSQKILQTVSYSYDTNYPQKQIQVQIPKYIQIKFWKH